MWVPSFCHIANCLKSQNVQRTAFCSSFFLQKEHQFRVLNEYQFWNINGTFILQCQFLQHIPTWHFEIRWQPGKKMNLLMIAHLWHFLFRHVRIIFRTCRKIFSKCCQSVSYHVCISYLLLVLLVRLLLLLYQIEREIFFRSHKKS